MAGTKRLRWRGMWLMSVAWLLLAWPAGCGGTAGSTVTSSSAPQGSASITIQDARGTVTLPGPARRIATQQWQFTEDLIAIGVQPVLVADDQGVGTSNPMPPEVKGKLGHYTSMGSRLSPNMEVLSSQPLDLIIVDKNEQAANYQQFAKIAPTMVLDTWSWTDFFPNLEKIGRAAGKENKAAEVESSLKQKLADGRQKIQARAGLRALAAVPTQTGFFPFTANSPQAGLLTDLGLAYAYPEVPGKLTVQVNLEALPPLKPDVIFLAAVQDQPTLITDTWKGNALWQDLPAVQKKRVVTVDRGTWSLARGALAIPLIVDQTVRAAVTT